MVIFPDVANGAAVKHEAAPDGRGAAGAGTL